MRPLPVLALGLFSALLLGCNSKGKGGGTASDGGLEGVDGAAALPSANDGGVLGLVPAPIVVPAEDAGPMAAGIPLPQSKIDDALNPEHRLPYQGPVGYVEGVIRIQGDLAPKTEVTVPEGCGEAQATYGKLFREGTGRTLADVLVAVTEYEGFVPPPHDGHRSVRIHGCAYESRTIDVTFGEPIKVFNLDPVMPYVPVLLGARHPAQMVAIPRGDGVSLYPLEPGRFALADGMTRTWMFADVFVVQFPTHTVTGLDGKYRIEGIPVGKAKVSALLPVLTKSESKSIEITEGQGTHVDFTLSFKVKDYKPEPKPVATDNGVH